MRSLQNKQTKQIPVWCAATPELSVYSVMFVLLMFCMACHGISKSYGFYFPADEFGYWSFAARLAGYDWSDIASLSSYYSYGYSLVLFPVFALAENGIAAYRAALAVNYVMLAACYFLIQRVEKDISPFSAAVAVFYPTWLFYAGTTFAEILLVLLYVVICLLLCAYLRTGRKYFIALLFGAMLYMYFVHMRAIGVLGSGIVTLLVYDLCQDRRRVRYTLMLLLCTAAVAVAGTLVKNEWTSVVYSGTSDGLQRVNDYAGQAEKLLYLFTAEGMRNFVISVAGKLLYLGLASFGIAYFGIAYAVLQVFGKKSERMNCFYLFVLLSTLAAVLISAVYTIYPGRVDTLAYGRYQEYVVPILLTAGIKSLREKSVSARKMARSILILLALEAVMTWLVTVSLRAYGQTDFFGNTICGISWLYNPERFEPVSFYCLAYGTGAVLTVLACVGIWWTGRKKAGELFLMLLVALQIAVSMRLSAMYLDDARLGCFRDTMIMEKIQEINTENTREVYYSTGGENFGNIGILQFMMRDTKIHIIKENYSVANQRAEDLLLTDYRSSQAVVLKEVYDRHLTCGHFTLFYNETE